MMFHNPFPNQLKEMLKGLKKTKAQPQQSQQPSTIRSAINENNLKHQAMMEQQAEEEPNPHHIIQQTIDHQMNKLYQQCFDLFLQGNQTILEQKLEQIKNHRQDVVHQPRKQHEQSSKSKFEYSINFDEEKDAEDKSSLKKRNRPIMSSNRINEYCIFCPDNEQLQLLSASNYVYLALPKYKTFRNYFHLILAPVDHEQTMIGLNEDVLTEINNYKKCLLQAFDKINLQVVFFQQYNKENSHIYIECLAMSFNKAQDLPFFFKQGLEDVEGNWSTHKNIIKIEKEKGGLQKQIPKPIKYFYIDFSLGYGYAHVIENQRQWKREFCYEILATALGLQQHQIKTTQQFSPQEKAVKRENFNKIWRSFDWTQLI